MQKGKRRHAPEHTPTLKTYRSIICVPTFKYFVIYYITSDSREFTKSANSMAFCVHHFLVINYSYILKDKNETWRTFITKVACTYGPNCDKFSQCVWSYNVHCFCRVKFKDNHERRFLGTSSRFSRTKIIYYNHHVQNFMKKAVGVIFFVPHGSSKAIDYIMFASR